MVRATRLPTRGIGVLLMLVAAWGGIVAFVGPTFDFDMGSTTRAWVWNESHATLYFAPALVGVLGGLLMLVGPWMLQRTGALLAMTSGVWFLIGPTLEPLWHDGGPTAGSVGSSGGTLHRVLEGIGYHYGTGAVMVMLSAFALGLLALAPVAVARTAPATPAERQPRRRPSFRHPRHA